MRPGNDKSKWRGGAKTCLRQPYRAVVHHHQRLGIEAVEAAGQRAGIGADTVDLDPVAFGHVDRQVEGGRHHVEGIAGWAVQDEGLGLVRWRSEEHTSELQSLMRISYAVFCLKKKNNKTITPMLHSSR